MEGRRWKEENMVEIRKRKRQFPEEKVGALQPPNMASRALPEIFLAPSRCPPTEVYLISTTNENKEVSVCESHEVPEKSGTDGTASACIIGNLSLDALSQVKRALQKALEEKQKQLPVVNIKNQNKEPFQPLEAEIDVDPGRNTHFDARISANPRRKRRTSFQFVDEGTWSKEAEIIKLKRLFGEAQTKELKAKQTQLAKAEPGGNPNLIEVSERVSIKEQSKEPVPEIEWWDHYLLLSGTYADITDGNTAEGQLNMEKITSYMEHPTNLSPTEPAPPLPRLLKLTKEEQRKLRKQQRQARENNEQAMIAQALLEPPKPIVKMSNFMKILGCEATQNPTRLDMKIRKAAIEREQAHHDRNSARKLTPNERREKRKRKLFGDPDVPELIVSVYKVNNELSYPQIQFKVNVNAHENRLTGCAVISEGISVVVVEGGKKSTKRYQNLMLRRIDWASAGENGDEDVGKTVKCVLVWQGSVAKLSFDKFCVHKCRTKAAAHKVFSDAGVSHYWDLAFSFTDDHM